MMIIICAMSAKNDISTNKLVLPTKPRIQKLILDHLKKWVTYFPSVADNTARKASIKFLLEETISFYKINK